MNRRVYQHNSPVQHMMASFNPSLCNINNLIKPPFIQSSSSPSSSSSTITNFLAPPPNNNIINHNYHLNHSTNSLLQAHQYNNMNNMSTTSSWLDDHHQHRPQFPESWSQLLLGGVFMEEEEKKMKKWEEQILLQQHRSLVDHVKQESSVNSYTNTNNNNNNNNNNNTNKNVYSTNNDQEFQIAAKWSPQQINIPASSPQSCVTNAFTNNMLDFSSKCISDNLLPRHDNSLHVADHSSMHNCTATNGALKKAKVQPSSSQSTFKVRKEKLGDRITTLHQLVSPFGKTDTASVLLEAIGYIRFLQSQVEALGLPYLTSGEGSRMQPYNVQGEKKCKFPEDPGQLLNENCLKRKGGPDQDLQEEAKDLRSRGLCLVPLSCTMHVGSDNGADYWAPAIGGGFR